MFRAGVLALTAAFLGADAADETLFKENSDKIAGTVWTATTAKGEKSEMRFEWVLDKQFLKETWTFYGDTGHIIHGIDPATGKETAWCFDNKGRVGRGSATRPKAGVLVYVEKGQGKLGPYSWKSTTTDLDSERKRVEIQENIVDGKAIPPETIIMTRKK